MAHSLTQLEEFVFSHAVLFLVAWPMVGFLLYRALPWAFGPVAAAAWSGRRRTKLIIRAFAIPAVVVAGIFFYANPSLLSYLAQIRFRRLITGDAEGVTDFTGPLAVFGAVELWAALMILMAVKLWGLWVKGRTTDAERAIGRPGVRAWLSMPNWLWAFTFAIGLTAFSMAAMDHGVRGGVVSIFLFWEAAAVAILIAYPALRTLADRSRREQAAAERLATTADLSPERQRVLKLLEDGRITADEASELINALAATSPHPSALPADFAPAGPVPIWRKLLLAGVALVLVGFFLPWYRVDLEAMQQRMWQSIYRLHETNSRAITGNPAPSIVTIDGRTVAWPNLGTTATDGVRSATLSPVVSLNGGDIGRGIGWIILATAIATAALAFLATNLSRTTRRQIMWLTASAGTLLCLYLITSSPAYVSFGLMMATAGQGLLIVGLATELPRHAALPTLATQPA